MIPVTAVDVAVMVGAVWSLVMLVTYDGITAGIRRRILAGLLRRRHQCRALSEGARTVWCVCGWDAHYRAGLLHVRGRDPTSVDVPDDSVSERHLVRRVLASALDDHLDRAYEQDRGWSVRLLTCPYCVAMWAAAAVVPVAVVWGANRVVAVGLLVLAVRAVAGWLAATQTPPDSVADEVAPEPCEPR